MDNCPCALSVTVEILFGWYLRVMVSVLLRKKKLLRIKLIIIMKATFKIGFPMFWSLFPFLGPSEQVLIYVSFYPSFNPSICPSVSLSFCF